jgi:hypothetical protein
MIEAQRIVSEAAFDEGRGAKADGGEDVEPGSALDE